MADMLLHPRWLSNVLFRYLATTGMPTYENFPEEHRRRITQGGTRSPLMRCDSLNWDDIAALREAWPGSLIVKGLLNPQDAAQAFRLGADAVVVSNHGGRNVDSAIATMEALPLVLDAVPAGSKVLVDSGVRRGGDIVKAIAMGAHGVLVGRVPLYGVAVAGREGATHALRLLQREMDITLAMIGRNAVADLTPDLLGPSASRAHGDPVAGEAGFRRLEPTGPALANL